MDLSQALSLLRQVEGGRFVGTEAERQRLCGYRWGELSETEIRLAYNILCDAKGLKKSRIGRIRMEYALYDYIVEISTPSASGRAAIGAQVSAAPPQAATNLIGAARLSSTIEPQNILSARKASRTSSVASVPPAPPCPPAPAAEDEITQGAHAGSFTAAFTCLQIVADESTRPAWAKLDRGDYIRALAGFDWEGLSLVELNECVSLLRVRDPSLRVRGARKADRALIISAFINQQLSASSRAHPAGLVPGRVRSQRAEMRPPPVISPPSMVVGKAGYSFMNQAVAGDTSSSHPSTLRPSSQGQKRGTDYLATMKPPPSDRSHSPSHSPINSAKRGRPRTAIQPNPSSLSSQLHPAVASLTTGANSNKHRMPHAMGSAFSSMPGPPRALPSAQCNIGGINSAGGDAGSATLVSQPNSSGCCDSDCDDEDLDGWGVLPESASPLPAEAPNGPTGPYNQTIAAPGSTADFLRLSRGTPNPSVYLQLRQTGFSHDQAARGLMECGGAGADYDSVMLYIVSEMETASHDEEIQAVIAMSESERENIQDRKRRREFELEHSCSVDLAEAPEFCGGSAQSRTSTCASLLLQGFPPATILGTGATGATTTTAATTSGEVWEGVGRSMRAMLHLLRGARESCASRKPSDGFPVPNIAVTSPSHLAYVHTEAANIDPSLACYACTCPAEVRSLRTALFTLLSLEKRSLQWYSRPATAAYLLMAARRIDEACGEAEAMGEPTSSSAFLGSDSPREGTSLGLSVAASMAAAVTREVEALQASLFAIPEEGSGSASAPRAFLDCAKRVVFNDAPRGTPVGGLGSDGVGGGCGDAIGSGLGGSRRVLSLEEDGIEIIE